MSYTASEASRYGGKPVELYRFRRRSQCWHYTSAEVDIEHAGDTYRRAPISRSSVERSDDAASDQVDVSLDPKLGVVQQFMGGVPATPVTLLITRVHRGDGDPVVLFRGEVSSAQVARGEVRLRCATPLGVASEKVLPRVPVQRQCSHVLYDQGCGLDPADFQLLGTVGSIVGGGRITVPEIVASPPYYVGGVLRVVDTDIRLFITQHSGFGGTGITLLTWSDALQVGTPIELYAGCDRRIETCLSRFDNVANHMGFPFMPKSSPFDDLEVGR